MSELEAPPPPGSDTPVPADVVAAPRRRRVEPEDEDRLVPQTALERRAERRERERRARTLPPPVVNPMASAVPPHVAARLAWEAQQRALMQGGWTPPAAAGAVPNPAGPQRWPIAGPVPPHVAPASAAYPLGPAPAPHALGPMPAPSGPSASAPLGYGPWVPASGPWQVGPQPAPLPPVLAEPPKRRLTRRQTRAALLGSLAGQTLLALATHLLVAAGIVLLLWASLSEGGAQGFDALEADSLTDVVAFWADPTRLPFAVLIVLLVTGAIAAAGWFASLLWQRSVGLVGIKRSIALAYATTTAIGGFAGTVLWPMVLFVGLFVLLLSTGTSFTVGSMWGLVVGSLTVSVVLTGAVGMLFGWIYLLAFRPRPTWAQLEAERQQADADAERRAAESDAAELARRD